MRTGIKVRLLAFVVLSAIGMVYVGASYLGVVDRVLWRGYTVHVALPQSGGLFEGSEVTYRGVKIGKVDDMTVERGGLKVDVRLNEDARVPASSPVFVYNLSAVGEQYLSFEPTSNDGPMLKDGDTVRGTQESLPVSEEALMANLSDFVGSVDSKDLNLVVDELGEMFRDNSTPLRSLIDDAQVFIREARANEAATVDLIRNARPVLETQASNAKNIRDFSKDLASLTGTLASSDANIRKVLRDAGPAADELVLLVKDLRTLLPKLLDPLINVSEVVNARLPALEQLLVTFPRLVAAGPSALTEGKQKFGRVHLNLNMALQPCQKGFLPPGQWRSTAETRSGVSAPLSEKHSFEPYFPARCDEGPPTNVRGMKYAPKPNENWEQDYYGSQE